MEATFAHPTPVVPSAPRARRWIGRVLVAVPLLFLVFDAALKLAGVPAVAEASVRLGLPDAMTPILALLEIVCVALLLVPRTAPLGAVLLTGYLGGAVAIHLRIADPLLSHTLFPIYVGVLVWAGLFLRDRRVARLLGAA